MTPNEPGLELHEWETRWSELDELLEADAAHALPDACDFVAQALSEAEFSSAADGGENDELLAALGAARETADRIERGEAVDPGDVGAAVANVRALYEALRAGRSR